MRRSLISIISVLVLALILVPAAVQAEDLTLLQGEGTEAEPYLIGSSADFVTFSKMVDAGDPYDSAYYVLTNDIVFNDETFEFDADTGLVKVTDGTNLAWVGTGLPGEAGGDTFFDTTPSATDEWYVPDGNGGWIISSYFGEMREYRVSSDFKGVFDGCGHTLSGLLFYDNDETVLPGQEGCIGLFSMLSGTARDFTITGSYYFSRPASYFGGVAGYATSGSLIENVSVDDCFIEGIRCVGGIVGREQGSVENCTCSSVIVGGASSENITLSGIAGHNAKNSSAMLHVNHCVFTGTLYPLAENGADNTFSISNNFDADSCFAPDTLPTGFAAADFASGRVANFLNGSAQGGAWKQNVDASYGSAKDPYPLNSNANSALSTHANVYFDPDDATHFFNACDHTYGEAAGYPVLTAPDALHNGYYTHRCVVCDHEWVSGRVPALNEPATVADEDECSSLSVVSGYVGAYKLYTKDDLLWFASLVNGTEPACDSETPLGLSQNTSACAVLMDDIVFQTDVLVAWGEVNTEPLETWPIIGNPQIDASAVFSGKINGRQYSISGLYHLLPECSSDKAISLYAGFVGKAQDATIESLSIRDSYFASQNSNRSGQNNTYYKYLGGIVGYASNTRVIQCESDATIFGTENNQCSISNLKTNNIVYAGGIAGVLTSSPSIEYCSNTGIVSASAMSVNIGYSTQNVCRAVAGGIVAAYSSDGTGTVYYCSNSGPVLAQTHNGIYETRAGGIAGYCKGDISDCYNTGNVTANYGNGGGIVGYMYESVQPTGYATYRLVSDCINDGNVTVGGNHAGGIVGTLAMNYTSPDDSLRLYLYVRDCENSGDVDAGGSFAGGIVGGGQQNETPEGINAPLCHAYLKVENCTNVGYVDCAGNYAGGIVGKACGFSTGSTGLYITKCGNTGQVGTEATMATYVGGILGMSDTQVVSDCYNFGNVYGKNYVGGILGITDNRGDMRRCIGMGYVHKSTSGEASDSYFDPMIGSCQQFVATTVSSYYLNACSDSYSYCSSANKVTAVAFTSGEVTYLLSSNAKTNTGSRIWYQNLDNGETPDAYPVLDDSKGAVYRLGVSPNYVYSNMETCPHTNKPIVAVYTGDCLAEGKYYEICDFCGERFDTGDVAPARGHVDENNDGICDRTGCGHLMALNPLTAADCTALGLDSKYAGYYAIYDKTDLDWFSGYARGNVEHVKDLDETEKLNHDSGVHTHMNMILMNDIVYNEGVIVDGKLASQTSGFDKWTPIGCRGLNYYSGTIEGNGHFISGLYGYCETECSQGLVDSGSSVSIFNLTIKDSFFRPRGSSAGFGAGAFMGAARGVCEIENCYSLNNYVYYPYYYAGGFVGLLNDTIYITNCRNTSLVKGQSCAGGIIGRCWDTKCTIYLTACCNEGPVEVITTSSPAGGGIVGYACPGTITSCWNTGDITAQNISGDVHGLVGRISTSNLSILRSVSLDTSVKGISTDVSYNPSGQSVITADDFASGMATYILNNCKTSGTDVYWSQTLGTDALPVYAATHPGSKTVYKLSISNEGQADYGFSTWRTENGTSPEALYANEGNTVTLTFDGAQLKSIAAVITADSTPVALTDEAFTMPAADVSLTMNLVKFAAALTKEEGKVGYELEFEEDLGKAMVIIAEYDGGRLVGIELTVIDDLTGILSAQVANYNPDHEYALFLVDGDDNTPLFRKVE